MKAAKEYKKSRDIKSAKTYLTQSISDIEKENQRSFNYIIKNK